MENNDVQALWGGEQNLPLTFEALQNYVEARNKEAMLQTIDAHITYYTTGLAEETGEVCGAVKKLVRAKMGLIKPKVLERLHKELQDERDELNRARIMLGNDPLPPLVTEEEVRQEYKVRLQNNLEIEIGQVIQYLSNICTHYGLNLETVMRNSFNQTSKDFNSKILIP
jgi:NTP pyrophosphatase (non-canonical NTP hydrolase)